MSSASNSLLRPAIDSVSMASIASLPINLWQYRELIYELTVRSLKAQYKQSAIGYAWILLNPGLQLLVLSFVFSTVFQPMAFGGIPFPLFVAVGLIPWLFFTNSLTASTESLVGGGPLISSIYFPREILAISAILTRVVDLLAGLVILLGLMVYYGQPIGVSAIWMLPIFLIQLVFTLGLSLPLAALNLFFRDVRYFVGVALYLWFFLTPIFYSSDAVPVKYRVIWNLNPNGRLIDSYRWALFEQVNPPLISILWAGLLSLVVLALGYYVFKRMEASFADQI